MFYRKYRPQTVAELDNARIRETLGKPLLANNWGHAYLFVGPRGTGKTSAARILAKIVNCTDRKKGEEPCNKCDSCKAITSGMSLDVIEIDAASNTGVDDIRDLREKVKLAPTSSKYKVYIIDEVHMLSVSAFNALLKTLEEPPEHVIFVLATTDPQKLPETIVSRCLVYDFGRVTKEEIEDSIIRAATGEKLVVSKEVITALAAKARGSFRDAHKLLEQLAMQGAKMDLGRLDSLNQQKTEEAARQLLEHLVKRQQKEVLELVEIFVDNNTSKLKDLINSLICQLRDILLLRSGISIDIEDLKLSDGEIDFLVKGLVEAGLLMRDCPVVQLPLEMVVVEFCNKDVSEGSEIEQEFGTESKKSVMSEATVTSVVALDWPKVLETVKAYNHSLVALLRASRPAGLAGGFLTLEVFYKFHKERLEEKKNREILEKVVSDIMGKEIKIKFLLAEGNRSKVKS